MNIISTKLAKEIANNSFLHVLDCILGNSDTGYDLSTDVSEFEQNFEEDLEEKGIKVTSGKINKIKIEYKKLQDKAVKYISNKF